MENGMEQRNISALIKQYGYLFLRWLWLLILISGLTGGYAYFYTSNQTPIYRTATIVQLKSGSAYGYDYYSSTYLSNLLSETYARTMATTSTLDEVSALVGYNVNAGMLAIQPIEETQLMSISVTDTDPSRAALIANTLVTVFKRQIQEDQAEFYSETKKIIDDQIATLDPKIQDVTEQLAEETALVGTEWANDVKRAQLERTLSYYQSQYFSLSQTSQELALSGLQSKFDIIQKEPAKIPSTPIAPKPQQSAMTSALVGLVAASGAVVLIDYLNDSIRNPQEITDKWGIPVLGIIASYDSPDKDNELPITITHPRSRISEAFRMLRTNLQFASIDEPVNTVLVTSSSPGEGKTSISVNLSVVIAQSYLSAVLVDTDLRRPQIHKFLKQSNRVGLTNQFIHSKDANISTVKQAEVKGLEIITSGNLPPNPSELLSSERMVEILNNLKKKYKVVILDTTPLLVVPDAIALSTRVDGVLLVVNPALTKRKELSQVVEQLKKVNAKLLGVVINDVKMKKTSTYYQNYYSSDEYGTNYEPPKKGKVTKKSG